MMTAITETKTRTVREVLSGSALHRIILIRRNGTAQSYRAEDVSSNILKAALEFDAFYNCWSARLSKGPFQQVMVFEPKDAE